MVFSSFLFLFCFLPLCLACYIIASKRFKNLSLLFWSLVFYIWGAFEFFPVFIASCLVDFIIAKIIHKKELKQDKKFWLIISLILNVGLLGFYKYSNFFIHELNGFLSFLEFSKIKWTTVILPVGISFITFQKISYLIDIYRNTSKPAEKFTDYLLYISLFPQLIAGPIVRYKDIAEQIASRSISIIDIKYGSARFCLGLLKKILLADTLGNISTNINNLGADSITTGYAWLGVFCYGLQLYFDFSGYSDMAIGLGRVFGFKFLENFDKPFISQNFTEFWRRWHISLSRFMKDYLYIPLGGNRVSEIRSYVNLWIVFLVSGFWHGANWTYLFWGAFHGLFLTIDKIGWLEKSKKIGEKFLGKIFNIFLTLFFLQIGWVFFKSNSIHEAFNYLNFMFNVNTYWNAKIPPLQDRIIHNEGIFIFIISIIILLAPLIPNYNKIIETIKSKKSFYENSFVWFSYCVSIIMLCLIIISATKFTPFIYFQF